MNNEAAIRELTIIRNSALDLIERVDNVMKAFADPKPVKKGKKKDVVKEPSAMEKAMMRNLYGSG